MTTTYLPQTAKILEVTSLNATTKMLVLDVSLDAKPGQFVNLWIPGVDEKPFSVANDDGKTSCYAIAAVGEFSSLITSKEAGDRVGIRGPFGKPFTIADNKRIVLVGGGFGVAPLHFVGTEAQKMGSTVTIIIGARTKDLLIYLDVCQSSGFEVIVTTDDGSLGEPGRVTGPLERILDDRKADLVQACGPERMMHAVASLCEKAGVDSEVSLERYMKCGFGLCGQCSCDGKLVCRDGCVFPGAKALQFNDFGKFTRGPEGQKVYFS